MVQDRYLYHCFPRRGANSAEEIDKGLDILACIRDIGLLLLPESIEWSLPFKNKPPRTIPFVQSRVCFTDLTPAELPRHAEIFGHFALEFEMETARRLGAIPVFYIPQNDGGVGTLLVTTLLDARAVIERAARADKYLTGDASAKPGERFALTTGFARNPQDKKEFHLLRDESKTFLDALSHQATPWATLSTGMDALLSFFYPADNTIHDKPLQYYRQREWRIAYNFAVDGVEIMRKPSKAEGDRIMQIDESFFGRPILTDQGPVPRLNGSLVHPGVGGKTPLQLATRLIVPASAMHQVADLFDGFADVPEVVTMEQLA
jgi:hypothetical protein